MSGDSQSLPELRTDLGLADLRAALAAGWRDFAASPLFGLFFASFYVVGGIALYVFVYREGHLGWLMPAMAGFPIIAPFAAVGLYEVSRRGEEGLPLQWRAILGALKGRGDDQIMLMGAFIFVLFAFWVILAHGIWLIFLADAGPAGHQLAILTTPAGIGMLLIGGGVGALVAWFLFAMTVISLPMLVDRDVDAISAIIASFRLVRANRGIMLVWAALIALLLFAAMVPLFLGLLLALPILGHATWHLYRRAVK